MKKQFALALVFAGLVMNASVLANEEILTEETSVEASSEVAAGQSSVVTSARSYASNAANYVVARKDAVVETVKAHPYIASATASVVTLVAMYKTCSWFRRLIGMETEEDVQKKYATAFEL